MVCPRAHPERLANNAIMRGPGPARRPPGASEALAGMGQSCRGNAPKYRHHDFVGLDNVESIPWVTEIAIFDALGLEHSIARSRVLISAAQAATRLLEVGELEARLASLAPASAPLVGYVGLRPPEPASGPFGRRHDEFHRGVLLGDRQQAA